MNFTEYTMDDLVDVSEESQEAADLSSILVLCYEADIIEENEELHLGRYQVNLDEDELVRITIFEDMFKAEYIRDGVVEDAEAYMDADDLLLFLEYYIVLQGI